jgi:hypothetical protein
MGRYERGTKRHEKIEQELAIAKSSSKLRREAEPTANSDQTRYKSNKLKLLSMKDYIWQRIH